MSVEVTPRGTRGWEMPRLLRPLLGAMTRMQVPLYHRFGARMRVQGQPVLLLTTLGAKTGKIRHTILCWFPESDRPDTPDGDHSWLVVASGAGSAMHPARFINLARHPDRVSIEIGGHQVNALPKLLKGAERAVAWQRIVTLAPGYAAYEKRTDREIPVIRLQVVGIMA
jgi:deazaflavin-dependent oxidoreductase (nitroreductase family)